MSKTIEVTDEQYAVLADAAAARGLSTEALFSQLIEQLHAPLTQPQ